MGKAYSCDFRKKVMEAIELNAFRCLSGNDLAPKKWTSTTTTFAKSLVAKTLG
jgi:hypothetical protein